MKIAINGFGRIGRSFLRAILSDPRAREQLEVVAINVGPADPVHTAHIFKYDSIMGPYQGSVDYLEDFLHVDGRRIKILAEISAEKLPWAFLQVDWVVDCSGQFTHYEKAKMHLQAGAQHVLISAPGKGVDCTVVPGVNDATFKKNDHKIVSLGSCTTNALMPLLKIVSENFGIESAMAVTTHAYTLSQQLLDGSGGKDLRRARAAAINIVPTKTGAAKLVDVILPELKGKVTASALRVPVPNVSFLEITWTSNKKFTCSEIEQTCRQAAQGALEGIVAVCDKPLVSSDYIGSSYSVTVDIALIAVQGTMGKVCGWYDNEWGYSCRLKDFLMGLK